MNKSIIDPAVLDIAYDAGYEPWIDSSQGEKIAMDLAFWKALEKALHFDRTTLRGKFFLGSPTGISHDEAIDWATYTQLRFIYRTSRGEDAWREKFWTGIKNAQERIKQGLATTRMP